MDNETRKKDKLFCNVQSIGKLSASRLAHVDSVQRLSKVLTGREKLLHDQADIARVQRFTICLQQRLLHSI